jgi:hypothetical protein
MIFTTRRLTAALFAAVLALITLIPAAPAHAAWPECSRVWLTEPSYFDKIDTGRSRCLWPKDRQGGWVKIYRFAYRYLGATSRSPGGYGFGPWAMKRAVAIHNGKC